MQLSGGRSNEQGEVGGVDDGSAGDRGTYKTRVARGARPGPRRFWSRVSHFADRPPVASGRQPAWICAPWGRHSSAATLYTVAMALLPRRAPTAESWTVPTRESPGGGGQPARTRGARASARADRGCTDVSRLSPRPPACADRLAEGDRAAQPAGVDRQSHRPCACADRGAPAHSTREADPERERGELQRHVATSARTSTDLVSLRMRRSSPVGRPGRLARISGADCHQGFQRRRRMNGRTVTRLACRSVFRVPTEKQRLVEARPS